MKKKKINREREEGPTIRLEIASGWRYIGSSVLVSSAMRLRSWDLRASGRALLFPRSVLAADNAQSFCLGFSQSTPLISPLIPAGFLIPHSLFSLFIRLRFPKFFGSCRDFSSYFLCEFRRYDFPNSSDSAAFPPSYFSFNWLVIPRRLATTQKAVYINWWDSVYESDVGLLTRK
jgi:hypothetical protein